MVHLAFQMLCPHCDDRFTVYVPAADKVDADAKLDPQRRYVVCCPMNASRSTVSGSALRPVAETPFGFVLPLGMETPAPQPTPPPKRPWWRFW